MITAIGLDIVEISRIRRLLGIYPDKLCNRLLGPIEMEEYKKRPDGAVFLAGRFAAKEAVIKGLGAYLENRPAYRDIQIINDRSGQPGLLLPDEIQTKLGSAVCLVSITHERSHAAAVAVFSEER